MSWEKTNPGWKQLKIEQRIKKIMDQRANMSADLAEVLRIQESHGAVMTTALEEQQQKAIQYMDGKWASIDAIANAAVTKENQASSVKWLEHEIRRLTQKLKMKHMQKDADQKALEAARSGHETRLKRVQYALRKAEQFKKVQEELTVKAAPANEAGAEEKLAELQQQVSVLRDALENPDPTRSQEDLDVDADLLERHTADITALEDAFEAKKQVDSRDHYIARSVLPPQLKKTLPTPYTLGGVSVMWADMQDALYAAGSWPEAIAHETLPINAVRDATAYLSAEEFEIEKSKEIGSILDALRPEQLHESDEDKAQLYTKLEEPEQKTGVLGMLGKANPFKSASA